jgi:DNA-binding beta-propeller fold protein YncE
MNDSGIRVRRYVTVRLFLWLVALTITAGLMCGRFAEHPTTASASLAAPSTKAAAGDAATGRVQAAPSGAFVRRFVRGGTAVELTLMRADPGANQPTATLRAGDDVAVCLRITDAATGASITGAKPAAWLTPRVDNEPRDTASLARKIGALLQGSPMITAELDLNQFYVLALNTDATITVVDPRFGFGGTKLLALVPLPGNGADWVLSADGNRLFVSIPTANQVAAIDTATWRLGGAVRGLDRPTRLVLERDGRHVWTRTETGVAMIDAETISLTARFETGAGAYDVAVSDNAAQAFVSNRAAGTISVIDARRFVKKCDLKIGAAPGAICFSAASQAAYVLDERDGVISVIAGDPPSVVRRISVGTGATALRFAPGGRLGFVTIPSRHEVAVIDAAADRILRRVAADAEPDQIAFTEGVAYIRQAGSAMVRLVPLVDLAKGDGPTSVIDVPAGRNALGHTDPACLAPAIAPAVGDDAVLIANSLDQTLYYYKEGLSAPMGSFRNYGHEPCAVLAVDRSLRTIGPGLYQTVARLRRQGRFDLAVFLDNPRLIHCFELEIEADPTKPATPRAVRAHAVNTEKVPLAGRPQTFSFRLEEEQSGLAVAGKTDVRVLATLPARWQQVFLAQPSASRDGSYAINFTPPQAGLYCFYVACPSAGLALRTPHMLYQEVRGAEK